MQHGRTTTATTHIANHTSGTVELSSLRSKASPRFSDVSNARFARLSEEEEDKPECREGVHLTTTTIQVHDFPAISKVLMADSVREQ